MKALRLKTIVAVCCIGAVFMTCATLSESTAPAPTPEVSAESGDGVWLGLFTEKGPEDMAETISLEERLGRRFASLMWFTDFSLPFPAQAAENAWAAGSIPNVTWEPWFWDDNDKIHLADINAGTWDDYISDWGAAAAGFGNPVFVRWGHEFNGNWYPWGVANNGQDPENYIKAYRRVHDLVVRAGAKNVVWVWCPNSGSVPAQDWNDPLEAYPGDDYVDWIALDGYDFDGNASFSDIFSKIYTEVIRKYDKPIYIGEFATGRTGAEKAAWLREMHDSLSSRFPGIKGLVYFSVNKERDWRLNDSPEALAGAREIFSHPFYMSRRESVERLAEIFRRNSSVYKKDAAPAVAAVRKNIDVRRLMKDSSGNADWSGIPAVKIEGKNDLGGTIRFGWDSERFYVRADILSKFPLTNSQKNDGIWNGSCLEICISTDPAADPARLRFSSTDWQLGFAPHDPAAGLSARSWEWSKLKSQVPGAELASSQAAGGYVFEVSFPWNALQNFSAEAGMVLGFDFAVDDAGSTGQRSFQWIWNGNTQFYNSPAQWGTVKLLP